MHWPSCVCLVHFYYPPVKEFWSFNFCMGLQEVKEGVLQNLGPRKHRPQTRKTQTPWVSRKHRRSIQYFSNVDIIEYLKLSTSYISEREKGGCVILAPCHYIVYTFKNEQTSQLFSNIDMIRNDMTELFRLTMTLPFSSGNDWAC